MMRTAFSASCLWIAGTLLVPALAMADSTREADEQFQRGVKLAGQGDYDAAVAAFEAAQRASPHAAALYNLGQAYLALGKPVEAVAAFERYLAEAPETADRARVDRVRAIVAQQSRRIGSLEVNVDRPGAEIGVDGRKIGTSPLGDSLALAAGHHVLTVTAPGRLPFVESFVVHGGARTQRVVALEPIPREVDPVGQLQIECDLPGVNVLMDGRAAGLTPLAAPLLVRAGARMVGFVREAYHAGPQQRVLVPAAGIVAVRCELTRDRADQQRFARLEIRVPKTARVRVDGKPYAGGPLPPGAHDVRVTRRAFEDWMGTVHLQPGSSARLSPQFIPTREHLLAKEAAERTRRHWSIATGAAGLALLGAGVTTYAWNTTQRREWQDERQGLSREFAGGVTTDLLRRDQASWREANRIQRTDGVAVGLAVAGATTLAIAGLLFWTDIGEFTW